MSDRFEQDERVMFHSDDSHTIRSGTVFVHRGTVVAIESDDGEREMVHQNNVRRTDE